MTRITEQDLLARLDKFHDEVVQFADKFAKSTTTLEKATATVEGTNKNWWVVYKAPIVIAVFVIVVVPLSLLFTAFVMDRGNVCIVDVNSNDAGVGIKKCEDIKKGLAE